MTQFRPIPTHHGVVAKMVAEIGYPYPRLECGERESRAVGLLVNRFFRQDLP